MAGVGEALGIVGKEGVTHHYDELRMKKQQEWGLKDLEVKQQYAKENQQAAFAQDDKTNQTNREHDRSMLDARTEADKSLLLTEEELRTKAREDEQDFTAEQNALDRANTIQAAITKAKSGPNPAKYLKDMLRLKTDQLNGLMKNDLGIEEPPPQVAQLRNEIKMLETAYAEVSGVTLPKPNPNPNPGAGTFTTPSGIQYTVE